MGISAGLALLGVLGFAVLGGMPAYAGAILAGVASTVQLILLMSIPAIIAKGLAVTRLAAGMTLVGLTIAVALSLLGGFMADNTGSTEISTIPALIFAALAILALGRSESYADYL